MKHVSCRADQLPNMFIHVASWSEPPNCLLLTSPGMVLIGVLTNSAWRVSHCASFGVAMLRPALLLAGPLHPLGGVPDEALTNSAESGHLSTAWYLSEGRSIALGG